MEILKNAGFDFSALFTETQRDSELVDKIVVQAGVPLFKVKRYLDKKVFDKHPYDGHIPISAVYAFVGVLYSVLYGYSNFIVANEYSSNFGNIKYKGINVNHQWSKSSEFEKLFQDYIRNFVVSGVNYFSLLRPFYEIRITKIFSKHKKYFPYFSSCNKNFLISGGNLGNGLWCGECAKCVFVFTLLSAFLKKNELLAIFKKNLFDDEALLPMFADILGLGNLKPFDCVGTFEESKAAFTLGAKKFKNSSVVKKLLPKVKISRKQTEELFRTNISLNIPSAFRLCGMESVLILGYGREGAVSKRYLKATLPELKIGVADKKISGNYLKKQRDFDAAIKTPGIPARNLEIPYTTATNIFFDLAERNGNKIIGVTGSKGKSTTASLIHSIVKESGKDVRLLGNIGQPMLEEWLCVVPSERIFVLELSSYQLENLDISPDIAVITNLFPEHMDYHGGADSYFLAKKNIIKYLDNDGIFVFDKKNKILSEWAEKTVGKSVDPAERNILNGVNVPLIGEHNLDNILLAWSVGRELGIDDETIKKAVEKFKPLPHRLEFVGDFKGIKFYDDAISTTPESTIKAIESLENISTIFLGGEDRGFDFSELEKALRNNGIKNIVLFPKSGNRILKSRKGFNIYQTKSMQKAVEFAFKYSEKGSVCLLSCASPSYSLWKNFEEKGDEFKKFVKKIGK